MTKVDIGNGATTDDLGVSQSEERLGVIGLLKIAYKDRATVVIAESADGLLSIGTNATGPGQTHCPEIGTALAKKKAIENLLSIRSRWQDRQRARA